MTDELDRMVTRMRGDDPAFGSEYDLYVERAAIVLPIVEARRARGWSQRELASRAGVQQPVLARLERGDTDPRASTLLKLARALDLQLTWQRLPRQSA